MPTPAEKKALGFVAAVFAAGVVVRAVGIGGGEPPSEGERRALGRQIAAVDSLRKGGGAGERPARRRASAARASSVAERPRGRPTAPTPFSVPPPPPNAVFGPRPGSAARGSRGTSSGDALDAAPVDLDRASAAEIERLPRIGPALAQRIVDDRRRLGPFGSIEGLQRVRGIGPALAETLRARVTFSTAGRPYNARSGAGSPPSLPAGPTPRRSRPRRGDAGSDGW